MSCNPTPAEWFDIFVSRYIRAAALHDLKYMHPMTEVGLAALNAMNEAIAGARLFEDAATFERHSAALASKQYEPLIRAEAERIAARNPPKVLSQQAPHPGYGPVVMSPK